MVFFIVLAIFFSGCSFFKSKSIKTNYHLQNKIKYKKKGKKYLFKINNLHCKLCAYNLVKYISKISGVNNIEFNLISNRYQDSYFEIYIDSKKIDIQEVYSPLIKSGFSIDTLNS